MVAQQLDAIGGGSVQQIEARPLVLFQAGPAVDLRNVHS